MCTHQFSNFSVGDLVRAKLHHGISSAKARSIGIYLGVNDPMSHNEELTARVHWSEIGMTNERPHYIKKVVI